MDPLPYVDAHETEIRASREAVWRALSQVVAGMVRDDGGLRVLTRVLGTEPPAGFAIAEQTELERLVLRGRHRFSRYELAFDLDDAEAGRTRLRATTRAAFPGPHGRAYRALVIDTRLHVLATRAILRRVATATRETRTSAKR